MLKKIWPLTKSWGDFDPKKPKLKNCGAWKNAVKSDLLQKSRFT